MRGGIIHEPKIFWIIGVSSEKGIGWKGKDDTGFDQRGRFYGGSRLADYDLQSRGGKNHACEAKRGPGAAML